MGRWGGGSLSVFFWDRESPKNGGRERGAGDGFLGSFRVFFGLVLLLLLGE